MLEPLEGYDSETFKMYFSLEIERDRFERWLNQPREFDDPKAEEAYYEKAVCDYISRIHDIID